MNDTYKFNSEEFGIRLKKAIKQAGYTQNEFADETGIPLSTLQTYWRKKDPIEPKAENLLNIARGLETSVENLLTGNETNNKSSSFYPDIEDITARGIFEAVNYLLVAFGDKIIDYCAIGEEQIPCIAFFDCYQIDERLEYAVNDVGNYLHRIKYSKQLKNELISFDEKEMYIKILKKWANLDNCVYDKSTKEIISVLNGSDLPFKEDNKNEK